MTTMLRIIQNSTTAGTKSYYSTADYFSEGQELQGVWRGEGAKRLGLSGAIEKRDWDALCDNVNPATGEQLTARMRADRRVGFDMSFHVPKSVSVLYGITGDERLVEAFRSAVGETMQDMEREMQARVRKDGRNEDRTTGNMVWGEYLHTTARPVDGVPDPHLHIHAFCFNTTFDAEEQRWKAGQFAALKRDAPYFEAVFHSRLAHNLAELGLPIERTRKGWEISGIDAATLKAFSRRTTLIEDRAKEEGITDPAEKAGLGAKTRDRKAKHLSMAELQAVWRERLSGEGDHALRAVASRIGTEAIAVDSKALERGVDHAIAHSFERSSVIPERTLVASALKATYGASTPEQVVDALKARPLIRGVREGRMCVTTREVLDEERRMIGFARDGRGTLPPLARGPHVFKREMLNDGQRKAVEHVLHSYDRVMVIRGGAGTGKTTMMQEAAEAIGKAGKKVFAFAPSADASRGVLRGEGFESAETVARLLKDERLQDQVRDQVLWIDEAGLLSSKDMTKLFDVAERQHARVVLSGDRKQHGSVQRGAALRLLEEEAGVVPVEVTEIVRQKAAYKEAVRALADGRTADGFRQLDQLGWVKEAVGEERERLLAQDYLEALDAGKSVLVVSPTHREGDKITATIREALKGAGRLGTDEHVVPTLVAANLTEAERADAVSYEPGDVLVFHQNAKGYTKGDRVQVDGRALPLEQAARFQVYHSGQLALAEGDRIRITANGATLDGKHTLYNGATYQVKGFDDAGDIQLSNGWTIARGFGHLSHGYCSTSHASQGKTVDRVLVAESADSFVAASQAQFYVSVSRGKQRATIYSEDKQALLEAVSRGEERISATELVRDRALHLHRLQELQRSTEWKEREHEPERTHG